MLMKWYISHQSALEFWRKASAKEALSAQKVQTKRLAVKPEDAKGLRIEELGGLSLPLHVLVGSENARKVSRKLKSHISSGIYPSGSFIRAAQGLIVSSPELCFMQMASVLSLAELVMLGFEFCGSYRLDRVNEPERGFRDDQPLSSKARLESYIARATGLKGRTKAKKALRFIANNSASPMETVLNLLLTLPYRLGGYGFSMPLLNCRIDITKDVRKPTGVSRFYCDLYWPAAKVDVEYDSETYHAGSGQIARDARRRNALVSAGITVLTVSWMQVAFTSELRELAKTLSKLLKKRLQFPQKFPTQNTLLRQQLLPRLSDNRY